MKSILFLFFPILMFSQSKKDSLIIFFRENSERAPISFNKNSERIKVYQLCERWYKEVYELKKDLNHDDISKLEKDENATLNVIAILSEIEKNGSKDFAKKKVEEEIGKNVHQLMTRNCSDAIVVVPKELFLIEILRNKNLLSMFPNFKLAKRDFEKYRKQILKKYKNFPV